MKDTSKYATIVALGNVVLVAILIPIADAASMDAGLTLLIGLPIIVLLAELILGIVLALSSKKEGIGAGILIGLGISLLIGLSICGVMMQM
jgi:VIT1/CCC1 family predicted Fe2+/Mn2+ transporter